MSEGVRERRFLVAALLLVTLLLAVGCLWWSAGGDVVPEAVLSGEAESVQVLAAERASVDRVSLPAGDDAEAQERARANLSEWTLRVLAIDERGESVQGVEVTAASGISYEDFWSRTGLDDPIESDAQTDAEGRATLAVRGPLAFVRWNKDRRRGGGAVVERTTQGDSELILPWFGPLPVGGIVLDADGNPVAKAVVEVLAVDDSRRRETVEAAADGTFSVPLILSRAYELRAKVHGEWTPTVKLWPSGDDELVELRPAAAAVASIRGVALTPAGEPVLDGTAYAVFEGTGERHMLYTVHGEFRFKLMEFGVYHVSAAAPKHGASLSARVELTPDSPHQNVTVRLTELRRLRGHVVDAQGVPMAGAQVLAAPSKRALGGNGVVRRVVGEPERVQADDDGAFEFQVSPGVAWDVTAMLSRNDQLMKGQAKDVQPGSMTVEVAIEPLERLSANRQGGQSGQNRKDRSSREVRITLTRRDGGDLPRCRIDVRAVTKFGAVEGLRTAGWGRRSSIVEPVAGKSVIRQLSAEADYWLRAYVHDPTLAALEHGPIRAGTDPVDVQLELVPWAEVPVTVLDANGRPLPACRVSVRRASGMPTDDFRFTDRNGQATLVRVPPGSHELIVWRLGFPQITQTVNFVPGRNGAMVVRFP